MSIKSKTGQGDSLTEPRRALQFFTNRKGSIRHFANYLNGKTPKETILFFHGDGGNGKTLLLRYLKDKCCKRLAVENWEYMSSLEGDDFVDNLVNAIGAVEIPSTLVDFGLSAQGDYNPKDPFSALLKMRRDLSGKGLHFPVYDFASVLYLHKTGRLTKEKLATLFPQEEMDVISSLVDALSGMSWAAVAKAVMGNAAKHLQTKFTLYAKSRKLDEDLVAELMQMDPEADLFPQFPVLFAKDLNAAMELPGAPERVALFFDTHESFFDRQASEEKRFLADEWLRSLLCEIDSEKGIVAVVAGREEPRWPDAPKETIADEYIDPYLVGHLFSSDAADYLDKVGITEPAMKDSLIAYALVKTNEVHPFFLGLCADVVLAAQRIGKAISAEDFREVPGVALKGEELVQRLRRYVDRETGAVISALSACRSFNWELCEMLSEGLTLGVTREAFDYLTEFSFVWEAEGQDEGWYRIHDLMRRLADEQKAELTFKAHEFLADYYREQGEQQNIAAVGEMVYHENRINADVGAIQWGNLMEAALATNRYDLARILIGVRSDLQFSEIYEKGIVCFRAAEYYASLSMYDNALVDYEESIALLEKSSGLFPTLADPHNSKAIAQSKLADLLANLTRNDAALKNYQDAIASIDEALRINPTSIEMHNNKGNILQGLGNLQSRLSWTDKALDSYKQAINSYDDSLQYAPENYFAHSNKGATLQSSARVHLVLSEHQSALQNLKDAVNAFDEAIQNSPEFIQAYSNKGTALQSYGDLHRSLSQHEAAEDAYNQAILCFDEALMLSPSYVNALNNKGNAQSRLADLQVVLTNYKKGIDLYDLAITSFDAALLLSPNDVFVHSNRANTLSCLGDTQLLLLQYQTAEKKYKLAIESFNNVLSLAPAFVEAHNNKAITLANLAKMNVAIGRDDEALRNYEDSIKSHDEAIRLTSNNNQAYNNKGGTLINLGVLQEGLEGPMKALDSYKSAIECLDRALLLAPDYIEAYNTKGSALRHYGFIRATFSEYDEAFKNYEQSIACFDEALSRAPHYVNAHKNKGNMLANIGALKLHLNQRDEAFEYWRKAVTSLSRSLDIAPYQEDIREFRDWLQQQIGDLPSQESD